MKKPICCILATMLLLCATLPAMAQVSQSAGGGDLSADSGEPVEPQAFAYEEAFALLAEQAVSAIEFPFDGGWVSSSSMEGLSQMILSLKRSGVIFPEETNEMYYQKLVHYYNSMLGLKNHVYVPGLLQAVTALGKDPTDFEGHNLVRPIGGIIDSLGEGFGKGEYDAYALLDLDSGGYELPADPDTGLQLTREDFLGRLLECQLEDGRFCPSNTINRAKKMKDGSETRNDQIQLTSLALQAMAPYCNQEDVGQAINRGLAYLSKAQLENGGFRQTGGESLASNAAVIEALIALDISLDDPRFVKNGNTVLDAMMNMYIPGEGFDATQQSYRYDTELGEWVTKFTAVVYDRSGGKKYVERTIEPMERIPSIYNGLPGFSALGSVRGTILSQLGEVTIGGDRDNPVEESDTTRIIRENPLLALLIALVAAASLIFFAIRLARLRTLKKIDQRERSK